MKIKIITFLLCFVLCAIYTPIYNTDAEEQIIIPNVVTEDVIDDEIITSLAVDINTATIYNTLPEITFGCLTEIMHSQPMDDDYCDISECSMYDFFTDEELEFLYQVVEAETYGWYYENHRNVANVIFNRMRTGWGTLIEVLTQPNQFAVVTNGFYKTVKVSTETILAVEAAWAHDYTNGALYFNRSTTKSFASIHCTYLFTDSCGHNFYK